MKEVENYLTNVSVHVESWAEAHIKPAAAVSPGKILYDAMLYSLNAGGKKLRPALLFMGYDLFCPQGIDMGHPALAYAVSVEMIHTYSLIHDDLPGMDNSSVRRGKPSSHVAYGEATAILAGDGLLTKAFEIFTNPAYAPEIAMKNKIGACFCLLKAVGPDGMVGGQYADMASQGGMASPDAARLSCEFMNDGQKLVTYIHTHKTADFIQACVSAGAMLAGAADIGAVAEYGAKIGLAFQIVDDILDQTATSELLGKTAGSDHELDKLTYPKAFGLKKSREAAHELVSQAKRALAGCAGDTKMLTMLADYIVSRDH